MTSKRLAGLAAAAVVAVAGGPAAAAPPLVEGVTCGYTFVRAPGGGWVGEIDGGPVAAVSADVASLTLTCSIVAGPSYGYDDPPLATASATGPGVAAIPPTPFAGMLPDRTLGVCTHVSLTMRDGATHELYYDGERGEFTTGSGARCAVPTAPCTTSGQRCSPDQTLPMLVDLTRSVLCPVLALALPPDGDVPPGDALYDCPPY